MIRKVGRSWNTPTSIAPTVSARIAPTVKIYLKTLKWKVLPQSPYSAEIAPSPQLHLVWSARSMTWLTRTSQIIMHSYITIINIFYNKAVIFKKEKKRSSIYSPYICKSATPSILLQVSRKPIPMKRHCERKMKKLLVCIRPFLRNKGFNNR